jgi:hypothetical protein
MIGRIVHALDKMLAPAHRGESDVLVVSMSVSFQYRAADPILCRTD